MYAVAVYSLTPVNDAIPVQRLRCHPPETEASRSTADWLVRAAEKWSSVSQHTGVHPPHSRHQCCSVKYPLFESSGKTIFDIFNESFNMKMLPSQQGGV